MSRTNGGGVVLRRGDSSRVLVSAGQTTVESIDFRARQSCVNAPSSARPSGQQLAVAVRYIWNQCVESCNWPYYDGGDVTVIVIPPARCVFVSSRIARPLMMTTTIHARPAEPKTGRCVIDSSPGTRWQLRLNVYEPYLYVSFNRIGSTLLLTYFSFYHPKRVSPICCN